MTDIATRARKIIVEHLGVEESAVTDTADILADLGADSLDTVELILAFEHNFGIDISDTEAEAVKTVGDLITLVTREHDKAA